MTEIGGGERVYIGDLNMALRAAKADRRHRHTETLAPQTAWLLLLQRDRRGRA